jgi:hypothetical protein
MNDDFDLTPNDADTERRLQALRPTETSIDAHAIWYEAGLRQGRRSTHIWQVATVASVALAFGSIAWRSNPGPAFVKVPGPSSPTSQVASGSSVQISKATDEARLQDVLNASGWNRIAASGANSRHTPSTADLSVHTLLEQLDNHNDISNLRS